MKKLGVLVAILLAILLISFSSAQNATEEKAYNCLKGKVNDKCKTLTVEEQAFSLLALSDNSNIQSECKSALKSKSSNNECWPSGSCKIKDTALALLALDNIKENTEKAEKWILKNNKTSELEWYLEIDSSQATQCEIKYSTTSKTINIAENKKISGNPGDCLELAYDNYWLKIKSSCLSKNFTVSCNKDFISALIYKKPQSNIWHVSSKTEAASSGGKTQHSISSLCFSLSQQCDYEGSLWAVLALKQTAHDINSFLPYLIAFSEDNEKFFPYTFLYILENEEEYLQEILTSQKTYWDLSGNKHYDTALALLALPESEAETTAKSWLEENQDATGCWNSGNIRDTAFLLWAGWPRQVYRATDEISDCEKYCISQGECEQVLGNVLKNYFCSGLKVCCDKPAKEETCAEKGGSICPSGKKCDEETIPASGTDKCCLGTCEEEITESECEQQANYICKSSCLSSEETAIYDCPSGKICCKPKAEEEKSYWWIWLLVILIILVILGIIFRNKLRILIFRMKSGFKKGPVTVTRPPFFPPAAGPRFRLMPRQMLPTKPTAKPATKTDKELEETLKKLKEMSK